MEYKGNASIKILWNVKDVTNVSILKAWRLYLRVVKRNFVEYDCKRKTRHFMYFYSEGFCNFHTKSNDELSLVLIFIKTGVKIRDNVTCAKMV